MTRTFAETGAERRGLIPYEILFGERPPFVVDFRGDAVTHVVSRRVQLRVVRVTGAEFVVKV